jgi:hypothetical protein
MHCVYCGVEVGVACPNQECFLNLTRKETMESNYNAKAQIERPRGPITNQMLNPSVGAQPIGTAPATLLDTLVLTLDAMQHMSMRLDALLSRAGVNDSGPKPSDPQQISGTSMAEVISEMNNLTYSMLEQVKQLEQIC